MTLITTLTKTYRVVPVTQSQDGWIGASYMQHVGEGCDRDFTASPHGNHNLMLLRTWPVGEPALGDPDPGQVSFNINFRYLHPFDPNHGEDVVVYPSTTAASLEVRTMSNELIEGCPRVAVTIPLNQYYFDEEGIEIPWDEEGPEPVQFHLIEQTGWSAEALQDSLYKLIIDWGGWDIPGPPMAWPEGFSGIPAYEWWLTFPMGIEWELVYGTTMWERREPRELNPVPGLSVVDIRDYQTAAEGGFTATGTGATTEPLYQARGTNKAAGETASLRVGQTFRWVEGAEVLCEFDWDNHCGTEGQAWEPVWAGYTYFYYDGCPSPRDIGDQEAFAPGEDGSFSGNIVPETIPTAGDSRYHQDSWPDGWCLYTPPNLLMSVLAGFGVQSVDYAAFPDGSCLITNFTFTLVAGE